MPEYLELDLSGAALRVRLADVGEAPPAASDDGALPAEFGVPGPVSSGGGGRAAALAADTLRATLRPLGPLLDQVHASVSGAEHPPDEFGVEFGVEVGKDLKLGIVGVKGTATMTVSAMWRRTEETGRTDGTGRAGSGEPSGGVPAGGRGEG
ncbi:CU044_2847 family protein [Streptomyces flavofungini]|uniref:CU044_2847 family protein n=1 Tax=Streptomyces flavofungini TaxID=68200 RepID=UPI0025AED688|nr:CU044_2847 family protein [Streptomyces flavofungini]WJV45311.1 CU044_2847 family protein [Streptomyces flavofungini]